MNVKLHPPQPGWIERLFVWGVAILVPVTAVVGFGLLVTARHQRLAGKASTPAPVAASVLLATPNDDRLPAVELGVRGQEPRGARSTATGSAEDCGAFGKGIGRLSTASPQPPESVPADRRRDEAHARRCPGR